MYNEKIHVFPFGLSEEAYGNVQLDEKDLPSKLGVYVMLVATDKKTRFLTLTNGADHVKRIKPALRILDGRPVENRRIDTLYEPHTLDLSSDIARTLTDEHRRWVVDGWYVQVGFAEYDAVGQPGIKTCIGTSMMLYDILTVRHGSVHMVDHEPLELAANTVREVRLTMGQHFQHGSVIFTPALERYRNKVAVMCRAALVGEDPIQAYQDFLVKSKSHFLDFEYRESLDKYETYVTVSGGPENSIWQTNDQVGAANKSAA